MIIQNLQQNKIFIKKQFVNLLIILNFQRYQTQLFLGSLIFNMILGKISTYAKESYHYIYNHPVAGQYLKKLLQKIYQDINQKRSCFLNHLCSHYTFINLNYSPIRQYLKSNSCEDIKDCEVPITNLTSDQIENYVQSQLGQKLLRYAYYGQYTIKKICDLNKQIKQIQIKQFYKKAVEKGLLFMMDMFSLNNIYILTDKIHDYVGQIPKSDILSKVKNSIALDNSVGISQSFDQSQLIFLYCQFNRLMPLSKIVSQHKSLFQKINVIKFVRLGIILGILQRVHHHVFYFQACPYFSITQINRFYKKKMNIDINNPKNKKFIQDQRRRLNDLLLGHLNNNDSMDQICCSLQIDQQNLLKMISPQKRYMFAFPE